jgi:lipopolysaccharide/colanic/teichoic acid biosynthesis glycosyltransferase
MRQPITNRRIVINYNQQTNVSDADLPAKYFFIKPMVDRLVIVGLSIVALPLGILISLAVAISDGRPIFFRQVRVGKGGRLFHIWKFRTMRNNAEDETGAVWSTTSDPRVTPLGRWLRCSHLDELPQFINVLCGDMNLVGPRPERPEFVETLIGEVPNYAKRTQVSPGITGLAQLRLGYDESVAELPRKVSCDLEYIQSASFVTDIILLCQTFPYIVSKIYKKWMLEDVSSNVLPLVTPVGPTDGMPPGMSMQRSLKIYRSPERLYESEVA